MPKVVRSAAQALGDTSSAAPAADEAAPVAEATAPTEATPAPEAKIVEQVNTAPAAPQPGFETPPVETVEETAPAASEAPVAPAPAPQPVETTSTQAEGSAVVIESAPVKKVWNFVKNVHTHEKIVFEDGQEFRFKTSLFVTRDSALAAKILAVASRHNIVEQ